MNSVNNVCGYYDAHADEYFRSTVNLDLTDRRERFLGNFEKFPKNLLDVGCGSCRDSLVFINKGIETLPLDNSYGLARVVKKELNIDVLVEDIRNWHHPLVFDAIWACASLLHLTKVEMNDVLNSLRGSLTADGLMYISLKEGSNAEATSDGRFFEYYSRSEFEKMLIAAGYEVKDFWTNEDATRPTLTWLNFVVKKKEVR